MNHFEIIFIAIGLAMDAFAVSLSAATSRRVNSPRATFRLSFHFGLFQFMMPVIGWFLGGTVAYTLQAYDHWIAFGLLSYVGGKMIYESLQSAGPETVTDPSRGMNLVILSLATSIDAFAIGFSLALLNLDIWYPSFIIGVTTTMMSLVGIRLGNYLGVRFGKRTEFAGGAILIFIGLRILIEHVSG